MRESEEGEERRKGEEGRKEPFVGLVQRGKPQAGLHVGGPRGP